MYYLGIKCDDDHYNLDYLDFYFDDYDQIYELMNRSKGFVTILAEKGLLPAGLAEEGTENDKRSPAQLLVRDDLCNLKHAGLPFHCLYFTSKLKESYSSPVSYMGLSNPLPGTWTGLPEEKFRIQPPETVSGALPG